MDLWSKKNLFSKFIFLCSVCAMVFYLIFSIILTPFALNKSRMLLSNENLSSFIPSVKSQQFSDSFEGFTFIVKKE